MAYVRGYIQENTKFHIGIRIPLSTISDVNSAMSISLSPTKDIYAVLCDDGDGKLIWKSNPADFVDDAGTFTYTAKNNSYYLKNVDSNNVISCVTQGDDDVLTYDSTLNNSIPLSFQCVESLYNNLLWGGVEYSASYSSGEPTTQGSNLSMLFKNFVSLITPGNTNSKGTVQGNFCNTSSGETTLDVTELKFFIFFIPHIDNSHDSSGLIQYSTEYTTSLHFFTDYINNTFPSGYYPLIENTFADENTIVIFTNTQDQKTKYVYSYCLGGSSQGGTCGSCMGICPTGEICSVHLDTSKSVHSAKLTCDHTPWVAFGETKSYYLYAIIVFVLAIAIIFVISEKTKGNI